MKTESPGSGWLSGRAPHVGALLLWLLSLALFWQPLRDMGSLSFHDERASHILVIPLISACLIFLGRKRIFCAVRPSLRAGIVLMLLAAVLGYSFPIVLSHLNPVDRLSAAAFLIVLVWIAVFVLCYGTGACKAAAFPLLFLFLTIPLPAGVAEHTVTALQKGSAEACYGLFRLMGVPFIRHGFQFSLPGAEIEIAEQCSGIHSGLSLFITGLLAGQAFLHSTWKKVCFALCIFPIAIFKNAIRIVTIAWLGIHVNQDFFYGNLHHRGGLLFAVVGVAMLGLLLLLLNGGAVVSKDSGAAAAHR